jgi:hypothetical protein
MDLLVNYGIRASSLAPSFPAYELLYDSLTANNGNPITLPTTQIDITGLSIGKNDELRLVYTLKAPSSTLDYGLYVNGNNTASSYIWQRLVGNGTSIILNNINNSVFADSTSAGSSGFADIKVSNNDKFVVQSQFALTIGSGSSSIQNRNYNLVGIGFTLTSITSLRISCTTTNGIAAGSRIRLYKVNTGEA